MGNHFRRFLDFTLESAAGEFAGQVYPAIVTRDYPDVEGLPDRVDLCVFTPEPIERYQVTVAEQPTRGCAHLARREGVGAWSDVRFVAADPEEQVAETFNEAVDRIGSNEQSAESTREFAPYLPGAGTPVPMSGPAAAERVVTGVEPPKLPNGAVLIGEPVAETGNEQPIIDHEYTPDGDEFTPIIGEVAEEESDLAPEDAAALEAEIAAQEVEERNERGTSTEGGVPI